MKKLNGVDGSVSVPGGKTMGSEKTTVQSTQQQQATPTAEETALNQLQLGQAQAFDPMQRQLNEAGGQNVLTLLQGGNLPGNLGALSRGIDPSVTDLLVQRSLKDVGNQAQFSGILDSGTAGSLAARTAGDIRLGAEEFNIGTLLNLLNLGVGGQAQVQQPMLQTSQQLGGRLAGLRSMSSSGSQTTTGMNPFLKSFQQSAGKTLGSPSFSSGPFTFGG